MATTTTLGKVSLTMGGNYSPTATYDRLTVVRGVTGNSYVTTVDGVSGISPGVTSGWENYWQLFAADGSGGGGGSTVTVTPIVTTGTKIATIGVDGTNNDLYAPNGGGSTVSVTQVVSTGTKIATITVDGTGTDLYAPNGGGSGTVTDVQVNGTSIVGETGVANIPYASANDAGVVKVNASGLTMFQGQQLMIVKGTDAQIKAGTENYNPVVPGQQHKAVFYGLAKAAGDSTQAASSNPVGTYTDAAKAAIQAMIGAGVEVVRLA